MSKAKKKIRTFNCALPLTQLDQLKHKHYAKNTNRKARWGVTAYCKWRDNILEEKGDNVGDYILKSDLTKPQVSHCQNPKSFLVIEMLLKTDACTIYTISTLDLCLKL